MAYPQNNITTIQELFDQITIDLENPGKNASILFDDRQNQILNYLPEEFNNSATNDQLYSYIAGKIQAGNHVYIFEKESTYPIELKKDSNNQIVIQQLRELGPAPEAPQKPNIWKRFANTITGGSAYRNDIENYRNYQEQMKEREQMEIALDGAAYPMYKRREALTAAANTPQPMGEPLDIDLDGLLDNDHVIDEFEQNNLEADLNAPQQKKTSTTKDRSKRYAMNLDSYVHGDNSAQPRQKTAHAKPEDKITDWNWTTPKRKQAILNHLNSEPIDASNVDLNDLLDDLNKQSNTKTAANTSKQIPFKNLLKEDTATAKPNVSKSSPSKNPSKDPSKDISALNPK